MSKTIFETKDYTPLYTPDKEADYVVELADIQKDYSILEPSAGSGQLLRAVKRKVPGVNIYYYEIQEAISFRTFTQTNDCVYCGSDFMGYNTPSFDRIVANPPFEEDMWYAHLKKMYRCLKPSGILVSIIPRLFLIPTEEKSKDFKTMRDKLNPEFFPIENWYTNKDGTKLPITIIKIKKT